MANDFKIGDVVELKSGSIPMTVVGVEELITCKWFNRVSDFPQGLSLSSTASAHYRYCDHQIGNHAFPSDALEIVKNKKCG